MWVTTKNNLKPHITLIDPFDSWEGEIQTVISVAFCSQRLIIYLQIVFRSEQVGSVVYVPYYLTCLSWGCNAHS